MWLDVERQPTSIVFHAPCGWRRPPLEQAVVRIYDHYSGIAVDSLFRESGLQIDDHQAGEELTGAFTQLSPGVVELKLTRPSAGLKERRLTVSVIDAQGNKTDREEFSARSSP